MDKAFGERFVHQNMVQRHRGWRLYAHQWMTSSSLTSSNRASFVEAGGRLRQSAAIQRSCPMLRVFRETAERFGLRPECFARERKTESYSRSATITLQRRASASTCASFSVVCRERAAPRRSSARTKNGMNNARASFDGNGNSRAGRSESIAAFASHASRSNCNVSPERFANGSRQVASSFLADCGPVATLGCDGLR